MKIILRCPCCTVSPGTFDAFDETVSSVRSFIAKIGLQNGPRPLPENLRSRFRAATDNEIHGVNMKATEEALFSSHSNDNLLKQAICDGWLHLAPASGPSIRGIVFHVIIRGTRIGIFTDAYVHPFL